MDQLEKLRSLLEEGFVTKEEYTQRRLQLVNKLTGTSNAAKGNKAAVAGNVDDTWAHDKFEGAGTKKKASRLQSQIMGLKVRGGIRKAKAGPSVLNRLGLPTKRAGRANPAAQGGGVEGQWQHDMFGGKARGGRGRGNRTVTIVTRGRGRGLRGRGQVASGRGQGRGAGGRGRGGRGLPAECPW